MNAGSRIIAATIAMLSAGSVLAHGASDATAASSQSLLEDSVRTANQRFMKVAAAVKEGYAPIPCASGVNGGAMGIHYVNAGYLSDDALDVARPEAVMYEPTPDGQLKLVAVEYITSKGPASLEAQLFNFNSAPNRYGLGPFYELHVWAWKSNPDGAFADMNPNVSCASARAEAQ